MQPPAVLTAWSVSLGPGSIYDFYFLKQGGGHWCSWTEYITKEEETIPSNAKVKGGCWLWSFGFHHGLVMLEGRRILILSVLAFQRTFVRESFKRELGGACKSMNL